MITEMTASSMVSGSQFSKARSRGACVAETAALRNFYSAPSSSDYRHKVRALVAFAAPVLCWSAVFGAGSLLFS